MSDTNGVEADINDVLDNLAKTIANQARYIAVLEATLSAERRHHAPTNNAPAEM